MTVLGEILDEHLLELVSAGMQRPSAGGGAHSSHGNDKGRVVGALHDIVIKLDNLFDPRYWEGVSSVSLLAGVFVRTGEGALPSDLIPFAGFL